ncbi:MAG: carotenoid oxygenase family protein [Pseudomonadales bacterium]
MPTTLINKFKSTIASSEHPYLNGAWQPNTCEYNATDLEVIGQIPNDINGVYLRNTENPVHEPLGVYHPFDGDGMIHMMRFENGKAEYRNRFVETDGFLAEQQAGESLWSGLAGKPSMSKRKGWGAHGSVKDSSSTDVAVHAGMALSTFYQCGEAYRLNPFTLEPMGKDSWAPEEGVSSHAKVDDNTGELLFFNYGKQFPFMNYGVVGKDNKLKHYVPIELPGPRLPHDLCFSRNYSILNDFPLFWSAELLEKDIHLPVLHEGIQSRFAVIPRYGDPKEIRWFEAEPTFVLHFMNAFEEGDEVVMDGYFQRNPSPDPLTDGAPEYRRLRAAICLHEMGTQLHRWRFNLATGKTSEEVLYDDQAVEFGTINQKYAGEKHRYIYSVTSKPGWFLFTGLVKHDLASGESSEYEFGDDRYASEAPFVPRINAQSEDDGYLVSFVTDMKLNRSECVLIDAQHVDDGPVCQIILPHRISSGTHATWAAAEDINLADTDR